MSDRFREDHEHWELLRQMDESSELWQAEKEGRSEPMTQNDWAYLYKALSEYDKALEAEGQAMTPYRMKLFSKLARRMHEAVSDE